MHGRDPLYSGVVIWLGSAMKRREFIMLVGGAAVAAKAAFYCDAPIRSVLEQSGHYLVL